MWNWCGAVFANCGTVSDGCKVAILGSVFSSVIARNILDTVKIGEG